MVFARCSFPVLLLAAAGCGSTSPTITISGYTVVVTSAPPATAPVGASVPIAFRITARKSDNTTEPASGKAFTVAVTVGAGTVNGQATAVVTSNATGDVSVTWVLGTAVGPQTIRGSASATEFLDITVTATPLPASQLAVASAPSTAAQSGAPLAAQPAVQLKDATGANVAEAGVLVTASIETGGGTLAGTVMVPTNASGLAVFTDLALSGLIGARTLKFTATLGAGPASVSSAPIALAAGTAAVLAMKAQPSSSSPTGFVLLQQPAIQLQDAAGNVVSQAGVAVTASAATGTSILTGAMTATTDLTGVATFSTLILIGNPGPATLGFSATLGGQSKTVNSASVAVTLPANGKVVFKSGKDELWVVNSDGTGLTQLTPGYGASTCQSGDEEPQWSPDGSKIVFSRSQGGSQDIWVMNANGTNPTRLTASGDGSCGGVGVGGTFSENPSWSADGTKIIFTSDRSTTAGDEDLWIMNADGSGQTKLFGDGATQESEAFFSPDGRTIVFQVELSSGTGTGGDLWLMNADGTNPRRLTTTASGSFDENASWSRDGQKIAYTRNAAQTCSDEVFIINRDGASLTPLTTCLSGGGSERPGFSPDGTKIVFANSSAAGNDTIWNMNPDGSGQVIIGLGGLTDNGQPAWQPVRP